MLKILVSLTLATSTVVAPNADIAGGAIPAFDYCTPIVWDEGSEMEHSHLYIYTADQRAWNALLGAGWTGRATDGMEALYPADCHAPTE